MRQHPIKSLPNSDTPTQAGQVNAHLSDYDRIIAFQAAQGAGESTNVDSNLGNISSNEEISNPLLAYMTDQKAKPPNDLDIRKILALLVPSLTLKSWTSLR